MTETPTPDEPDPQVEPEDPRRDALRCIECEFRADDSPGGWYDLGDHWRQTGHRYEHVRPAPKPRTVADIPAGQGPASLFLKREASAAAAVCYRADALLNVVFMWEPKLNASAEERAVWEHLAATLPTVTRDTKEA